MKNTIQVVENAGVGKVNLMNRSLGKYLVSSMLAGLFVGLGIILIFTIGGMLAPAHAPSTKIVMGISFGIALSLVIMAGSELFTGNNFVMVVSTLNKKNDLAGYLQNLALQLCRQFCRFHAGRGDFRFYRACEGRHGRLHQQRCEREDECAVYGAVHARHFM